MPTSPSSPTPRPASHWLREHLTAEVVRAISHRSAPPAWSATRRPICWPSISCCTMCWPAARADRCGSTPRARRWPWPCCKCRSSFPTDYRAMLRPERRDAHERTAGPVRVQHSAAVITLNRPDRRNALSRRLIAALAEAFSVPATMPPPAASSSPGRARFLRRHGPGRAQRSLDRQHRAIPSGTMPCAWPSCTT